MGRRGLELRGALQPLFVAGALDDLVTLAEADACSLDSVLFPQLRDLVLELRVLVGESRIVLLAEDTQKLSPPLGQRFDLGSDVIESSHAYLNEFDGRRIPVRSGSECAGFVPFAERLRGLDERLRSGRAQAVAVPGDADHAAGN